MKKPALDPEWKYPGLSKWLEEERRRDALLGPPEIEYYLVGGFILGLLIMFGLSFGFVLGWIHF